MPKTTQRGFWVCAAALVLATTRGAAGGLSVTPGQEFVYRGTAEWKQLGGAGKMIKVQGPVKLSAVVTKVDPVRGCTLIRLQSFQPPKRDVPPVALPAAEVATMRLTAARQPLAQLPRLLMPTPLSEVLRSLPLPLAAWPDLKAVREWRRFEPLPGLWYQPVEVVYRIAEETRAGGRARVQIQKRAAGALALQHGIGGLTVVDYGETFEVDPATGHLVSARWRSAVRSGLGPATQTRRLDVTVTLKHIRSLSRAELASRVKQARQLDQIRQLLVPSRPDAEHAGSRKAQRAIAAFRRQYPHSPYAVVVAHYERSLARRRVGPRLPSQFRAPDRNVGTASRR